MSLTLTFLGRSRLSLYSVKELATFLFAIATLVICVLAIAITFFFLWKGIKLGLLRLGAVVKSRLRAYDRESSLPVAVDPPSIPRFAMCHVDSRGLSFRSGE